MSPAFICFDGLTLMNLPSTCFIYNWLICFRPFRLMNPSYTCLFTLMNLPKIVLMVIDEFASCLFDHVHIIYYVTSVQFMSLCLEDMTSCSTYDFTGFICLSLLLLQLHSMCNWILIPSLVSICSCWWNFLFSVTVSIQSMIDIALMSLFTRPTYIMTVSKLLHFAYLFFWLSSIHPCL